MTQTMIGANEAAQPPMGISGWFILAGALVLFPALRGVEPWHALPLAMGWLVDATITLVLAL